MSGSTLLRWDPGVLFQRRKRLEELAKKEAEGASFWSDRFDQSARIKVIHAFNDAAEGYSEEVATSARALILRDEGVFFLFNANLTAEPDLLNHLMKCRDEMVPTVIEAMASGFLLARNNFAFLWDAPAFFEGRVGEVLREHRISFELISGQMVEFSSRELHQEVVSPTLRLLAGRPDLSSVESAYQDALKEISNGSPADAITDAGTALQELLEELGCDGKSLGPLIRSARSKGLLGAHDSPMLDSVERVLQWVSADRSRSGDSHAANKPAVEDAWLMVHVVGAVVLRLAGPTRRGDAGS